MDRRILFLSALGVASLLLLGLFSRNELSAKEEIIQPVNNPVMSHENQETSLASLWSRYQEAAKKDLPEDQLALLEEIIEIAGEKKLAWDYYDALQKQQEVTVRKDWKMRDKARKSFSRQVKELDIPIISFLYQVEYGSYPSAGKLVRKEAGRLKTGKHPDVWLHSRRLDAELDGQLALHLKDDHEFCLWVMAAHHFKAWHKELADHIGDRYPACGWLDLMEVEETHSSYQYKAKERDQRRAALNQVHEKYDGRAIALYARERLIQMDLEDCRLQQPEDEEAYRELYANCRKLLSDRRKLKVSEKKLYAEPQKIQDLLRTLKAPDLRIGLRSRDSLDIYFRNLASGTLTVWENSAPISEQEKEKKTILKKRIRTDNNHFYIEKKVTLPLPVLDDGSYSFRIENGKVQHECRITWNTLSLAMREHQNGAGIYLAESLSGEPLEKADFHLFKNGNEIGTWKDFPLEKGFTELPADWKEKLEGNKWFELQAVYSDQKGQIHKSDRLSFSSGQKSWRKDNQKEYEEKEGEVYLSQGAYRPGETLEFKAVLYEGNPYRSFRPLAAKTPVLAEILDSEDNGIGQIQMVTDEFGSVAGKFLIPEGLKNGMFLLHIKQDDHILCHQHFRVDEFILPEFTVEFLPQEEVYAHGDEVRVKGFLRNYSGHPVNGAQADYQVYCNGQIVTEGQLETEGSGEFRISFKSLSRKNTYGAFYSIQLRVTGHTGETHEYHTSVYVSGRLFLVPEILNETEADMSMKPDFKVPDQNEGHRLYDLHLLRKDEIVLTCGIDDQKNDWTDLIWCLKSEKGDTLKTGKFLSEETITIGMEGMEDGIYVLDIQSDSGRKGIQEGHEELGILKLSLSSTHLEAPVSHLFAAYNTDLSDGNRCGALFGANDGPTWAIAEWYGGDRELLESRFIHLDGKESNLVDLGFDFKPDYPEIVTLRVFFFKHRNSRSFEEDFRRPQKTLDLPLAWSSFQDKTTPGSHCTFQIQTMADAQCLAAIYDKSLDEIYPNSWNEIRLRDRYPERIHIQSVCGNEEMNLGMKNRITDPRRYQFMTRAGTVMDEMVLEESVQVAEAVVPEASLQSGESGPDVEIRSDLATTLSFQPFLQADGNGKIQLDFDTKDKLSTFVVSLFAHDKNMRNKILRQDMTVSVPLKVSVSEPAFLYDGDEWKMKVALSSNLEQEMQGILKIEQYAGKDFRKTRPFKKSSVSVTVPARGSVEESFGITADLEKLLKKMKEDEKASLGIKITFLSQDKKISDGIFLNIPVLEARQLLTESHSALWKPGMDKKELYRELRSRFTHGSGIGAETRETSILDLIREAVPRQVEPEGKDVLSYADALYLQVAGRQLGVPTSGKHSVQQLLDKILDCRNQDGGFGWFEGMDSSPIITATLLERFAKLNQFTAEGESLKTVDLTSSVRYLDQIRFNLQRPYWCGNISLGQYLQVRSLYPQVPFRPEILGSPKLQKEKMEQFHEDVQHYLIPEEDRGLSGQLFEKCRRLLTLMNLEEHGQELAASWGIGKEKKLTESLQADISSLVQYAVSHKDGGWYYPNLVLPFRGLLESEAYAHAMMSEVLERSQDERALQIADGIRLWLMIQKETQDWEEEPGFIDALHAVMKGSDEMKSTTVLVMTQRYEKSLEEIQASGNGMSIERKFYKETTDEDGRYRQEEMTEGTILEIGDVLIVRYQVHNDENRSFGKLTAWREAGLVPANQLSGLYGWGIRPILAGSIFRFMPSTYRDVHADRSVFYMDVMPEENFAFEEKFYVTRAGIFQTPVLEVESMYSPHYRANSGSQKRLRVK